MANVTNKKETGVSNYKQRLEELQNVMIANNEI